MIFYHNQNQRKIAEQSKVNLQNSGIYQKEIVTEIKPSQEYYLATVDHQQYLAKKRRLVNK